MRLIDANALSESIKHGAGTNLQKFFADVCVAAAPTVDAIPVVYCKDCKYADTERRNTTEKRYYNSILFCRNSNLCNDEPLAMWPDDFCSYGERKDETNES